MAAVQPAAMAQGLGPRRGHRRPARRRRPASSGSQQNLAEDGRAPISSQQAARAAALDTKPPSFSRFASNPWFAAGGAAAVRPTTAGARSQTSWSRSSIDHATKSRNMSGVRVFIDVQVGDKVRMRPSVLADMTAESLASHSGRRSASLCAKSSAAADRSSVRGRPSSVASRNRSSELLNISSCSSRLPPPIDPDVSRYSGDSFVQHVRDMALPAITASSIGTVVAVDLPTRQCAIDFATGPVTQNIDGSFVGAYDARLEEVEVVQVNDDFEGEEERRRKSMEATHTRAAAFQKNFSKRYSIEQKQLLEPGSDEWLRHSLPDIFHAETSRRPPRRPSSANVTVPAGTDASAYLLLADMDNRARRSFKTKSALFSGAMGGVQGLTVEEPYIEHEINACNVRMFLKKAYEQLAVALRIPLHGEVRLIHCNATAVAAHRVQTAYLTSLITRGAQMREQAESKLHDAATLFARIVEQMPNSLAARVGHRKACARLERLRKLRWEAEVRANQFQTMKKIHGPLDGSLLELGMDGNVGLEELRQMFNLIDADGSGRLDRLEVAQLVYFFSGSSDPPTEAAVDAAMLKMDPDGDGTVDFDEFNAWWQAEKAGPEAIAASGLIQAHFRGLKARRELADERANIVRIQLKIRQRLARKRLARKRRLLAEELEGKERRRREKLLREAQRQQLLEQQRGEALRAQAEAALRHEQETAAAKIQAIHRGRHGRREAAAEFMRQAEEKEVALAATKIQASFRGQRGRRVGESQRDYQKRMYDLNRRAMRMWTNRALGSCFSDWLSGIQEVVALKRRVLRRLKHGVVVMTFEAWKEYGDLCVRARQLASVEAVEWIVAEVERTDPIEQLRQDLVRLNTEPAEIADRLWHERSIAHYHEWAEPPERPDAERLAAARKAQSSLWARLRGKASGPPPRPSVRVRCFATRRTKRVPRKVVAGHTWKRDMAGYDDIAFKRGDIITVVSEAPGGGWWTGQLDDGSRGIFPSNYVSGGAAGDGGKGWIVSVEILETLHVELPVGDQLRASLQIERADGQTDALDAASVVELWSEPAENISEEPLPWAGRKTVFAISDQNIERIIGSVYRPSDQLRAEDWNGISDISSGERQQSEPTTPPLVFAGHVTIGLKILDRIPDETVATDFDVWLPCRPPPPSLHVQMGLHPTGALDIAIIGARNLPSDSSFDVADPYVLLELGPVTVRGLPATSEAGGLVRPPVRLKTKVVDNTLAPEWNETLSFDDTSGYGAPDSLAMYYEASDGKAEQSTLKELRSSVAGGNLTPETHVWWPALGHDDGVLRWQTIAEAESELGILGSTTGQLSITVLDKDFLSADDMICSFGPLMLADAPRVGDGAQLVDFWLEAASAARLCQRFTKTLQRTRAQATTSVESLTAVDQMRADALAAFNNADTDGNGLLDEDELLQVASWLPGGDDMTPAAIKAVVNQLDVDGSREVDFKAFFQWWERRATQPT